MIIRGVPPQLNPTKSSGIALWRYLPDGRVVVQKWPRRRPGPLPEITQQQVDTWDAVQEMVRHAPSSEMQLAQAATLGTGFYARDILVMCAYGHYLSWPGWGPYPHRPPAEPERGRVRAMGLVTPHLVGDTQPVNAVKTYNAEDTGEALIVEATTFLPATPTLLQFCCTYSLIDKKSKRAGEDIPCGNKLYMDCDPLEWEPTSSDGINHYWNIPNTDRPDDCDPCYLAIVQKGEAPTVHWTTQVHPCPEPARQAVAFDGSTFLTNPALGAADTAFLTVSCWLRSYPGAQAGQIWAIDPLGDYINYAYIGNTGTTGCFFNEPSPCGPDLGRFRFYGANTIADGEWHHVMMAIDTFGKVAEVTIDRVPCEVTEEASGNPIVLPTGGKPFVVGCYPESADAIFELYDYWVDLGSFHSPYDEANLDKFVDEELQPVDLGENGETPFGASPTIFGHGPAESFLQPNLGTGGDFSINGSLVTVPGPT